MSLNLWEISLSVGQNVRNVVVSHESSPMFNDEIPNEVIKADDLTPKQYHALCLLAGGVPKKEICKIMGITERTMERWQTLPGFKLLLKQAVYRCLEESFAGLAGGASEAVNELRRILRESESEKHRLEAIKILSRYGAKA